MGDEYNIYAYYCNQALVPGTPGRDAVVTDRNTGSEHSVEITWPIDGRHVIGQAKQMNKRGYTNLQIWDYDDLSRQQSAVARTIEIAHKKALRDYRCPGGSTIIFVFDRSLFWHTNPKHMGVLASLQAELASVRLRVDNVLLMLLFGHQTQIREVKNTEQPRGRGR